MQKRNDYSRGIGVTGFPASVDLLCRARDTLQRVAAEGEWIAEKLVCVEVRSGLDCLHTSIHPLKGMRHALYPDPALARFLRPHCARTRTPFSARREACDGRLLMRGESQRRFQQDPGDSV